MVSIYKYFGWDRYVEFKKFVVKKLKNEVWQDNYWFVGPQSDFVCNETGDIVVDFLGKFENLQTDFNQVCQHIRLPPTELPHINKSKIQKIKPSLNPKKVFNYARWLYRNTTIPSFKTIPSFTNYQDYYDDESRALVAQLYRKDIELFGYEFDEIDGTRVQMPNRARKRNSLSGARRRIDRT
jgi:hypothetical protein